MIQWTSHRLPHAFHYMQIDSCRLQAPVSEQLLYFAEVHPIQKQVRRERMPQGVHCRMSFYPGCMHCGFHGPLHGAGMEMVSTDQPGLRVYGGTGSCKDILPFPLETCARVLSLESFGE